MKRADQLDAIIVETTGLADPAPVAQTFFVDQDVADRTKLDAIVTVADAVHLNSQLGEHHEAEEQIAFADVVLLNKVDLVDEKGLENVITRIKKINPYAKIIKTTRCAAPLDEILGLNAFSLKRVLEVEPDFLESDHDHDHDDDVNFSEKDERYVFQGVHMLMDASPMGPWPKNAERNSRVVFIGRNLENMGLQEGFEGCKS